MTYRPIKHHGIRLAAGSFLHNAVFEPLAADPTGAELVVGRHWHNTVENVNKFTTSDGAGGVVINVATTQAAVTTLSDAVGNIGILATTATASVVDAVNEVNAKAVTANTRIGNLAGLTTTDKTSAVVAINELVTKTDTTNTNIGTLANLNTTDKTNLVAALNEVKGTVNSIGNAFNYVALVEGGVDLATAFDLSTLTQKDTGDYYKVDTAGHFVIGAEEIYANVGDGLVFNINGTVDVIDNTDSEVTGTADEIVVDGSVDTGFIVKIATAFKQRVSNLETLTPAIAAGAGLNSNGSYVLQEYSNYINSASTLMGATLLLDTALKAEENRAKGVEGNLASLKTVDKTDLVTAINQIHDGVWGLLGVDEKLTNVVDSIGGLDTDGAYIPHVSKTDDPVDGTVNFIHTAVDVREESVILDNKVKNALDSVSAIATGLNTSYATFKSVAAASTFTINHGLNAEFITVDVWVKDVNGGFTRYYNDIVAIEETDLDTVTITSTTDIEIKAVVRAIRAIQLPA